MLVTIGLSKLSAHLISFLKEDGHRVTVTGSFEVSFQADENICDDVVAMYGSAPGVLWIKIT